MSEASECAKIILGLRANIARKDRRITTLQREAEIQGAANHRLKRELGAAQDKLAERGDG